MKRFFITFWIVLCSLMCMGREVALVDGIVYSFNIGNYTATVLNFCTTGDVTIPSHVHYLGDMYQVEGIGWENFKDIFGITTNYDFNYDYDKYRSQITKLTIPSTVKYIGNSAFIGMNRVELLVIPASVKTIGADLFGWIPIAARLRTVFFLGTPIVPANYGLFSRQDSISPNMIDYKEKMTKHINAPKQTKVDFANAMNEKREYANLYKQYTTKLLRYTQQANEELRADKYYKAMSAKDDTIKYQSIPQYQPVGLEYDKKGFIAASKELRKNIANIPSKVKQVLTNKKAQAKKLLATSNPYTFLQFYMEDNPQCRINIDSIKNEYRNYSNFSLYQEIIIPYLIEGKNLPKSYRTTEYEQYGYLYNSKEEFDKLYNLGDATYQKDKQDRQQVASVYMPRISYFFSTDNGQYTKLKKGRYADKTTEVYQIIQYIDASKKYKNEECMQYLMQNTPFSKEYAKKGRYFADMNDFYEAYVGNNYNKVLRERKNKYNNK